MDTFQTKEQKTIESMDLQGEFCTRTSNRNTTADVILSTETSLRFSRLIYGSWSLAYLFNVRSFN